jgi:methionine-rich copper-binding protein CopC
MVSLSHRSTRPAALLATAALALVLLVLPGIPASAHARLLSSAPELGEVVDSAPDQIVLTFNEPIESDFGQLQVSGPDGERLDAAPPSADGDVVTAPVSPPTTAGAHTVAYRVISADGHPVEGTFTYEVAEAALAAATPTPTPSPTATETEVDPTTSPTPTSSPTGTPQDAVDAASASVQGDPGGLPILPIAVVALLALGVAGALVARRGADETGQPPTE